jgi:hypothetical protein
VLSFITAIALNSHVLSAAAGAITTWAVQRFSAFMGWYAKNEAAISKVTGVTLPAKLPTTVAELKAAAAVAAPTVSAIPAEVESALLKWKGDIVAKI